jgi:transposase, IS5 family
MLTKAGAIKTLFGHFDASLRAAGYIAMSGQIVDDRDARWTREVHQGQAAGGRLIAARRSGDPRLRLSESCLSRLRLHPQMEHDRCRRGGRQLREGLLDKTTASGVWADTAYRSVTNEEFLAKKAS